MPHQPSAQVTHSPQVTFQTTLCHNLADSRVQIAYRQSCFKVLIKLTKVTRTHLMETLSIDCSPKKPLLSHSSSSRDTRIALRPYSTLTLLAAHRRIPYMALTNLSRWY